MKDIRSGHGDYGQGHGIGTMYLSNAHGAGVGDPIATGTDVADGYGDGDAYGDAGGDGGGHGLTYDEVSVFQQTFTQQFSR